MGAVHHNGGCQCGSVQITAIGDPKWTARCHCADCRKATGAEASAFAGFNADQVTIAGDTFIEHESSPGVFRGFCSTCGSRLTYRGEKWPGEIHLHIGAMKTPDAFAPGGNGMTVEKVSWVRLEDDLPAKPRFGN